MALSMPGSFDAVTPTVKLIASDLDGTLFGADHQLSPRTIDALRAARAAGIRVVAATGRGPKSAVPRLAPFDVVDLAICSNGALVHDVVVDMSLHHFPIEPDHVEAFFRSIPIAMPELSFSWETPDGYGWDDEFAPVANGQEDLGMIAAMPHPLALAMTITKIMVHHPELDHVELLAMLQPHLPAALSVASSGVRFLEVTGVGVDKSSGLAFVCEQWGIEAREVVAFGDNNNDVAMLRWAGRGIAVENAAPLAREAADEVIGPHTDDSVAACIEELVGTH